MPTQIFTTEQIARVCHAANQELQRINGEEISPAWDHAPEWQRESAIDGVHGALAGRTPQQSHEGWLDHKHATGWTYGPVKDEAKKTHPCMVAYADLPPVQRAKDHLFTAIVGTLAAQQG